VLITKDYSVQKTYYCNDRQRIPVVHKDRDILYNIGQ